MNNSYLGGKLLQSRHVNYIFIVFSACGGIRTGSKLPVLTAYFPVLAKGILGKGGLFVALPLEDCLTGLTSTQAGTGGTELQLIGSSVAECQALT